MTQIARALAYLHSRKPAIIHRDVKPNNILVSADWMRAKLADFGISKTMEATLNATLTTGTIGTPEYCAPEVFNPQKGVILPLAKIDVYAFSMTLHHVVTNQKPFVDCENPMQIMFAVAGGRRPDVNLVPMALRKIMEQAWNPQPANRPTMQELLVALNPAAGALAQEEQEQREDASKCVVCMERPRSHVLIPCGHLCVCDVCALIVHTCPLDRSEVVSRHLVFQ